MASVLYITDSDVSAHLDTNAWQALFTLDGGTYDATAQAVQLRARQLASARARADGLQLGYTLSTSTDGTSVTDDEKWLALCYFIMRAFARKGRLLPDDLRVSIEESLRKVRDGEYVFAELEPDTGFGVGGITSTDATDATGRPPIMRDLKDSY